jgi:flagellar biosynthesis GTPase FlhF
MAKTVSKTAILAKLKKASKGSWKKARTVTPKAKGSVIPGGIVRGVAQVSSYKFDTDKNSNPYFSLTAIVKLPEEFKGQRMTKSYFLSETERKSVAEKLADLSSDLQLLGCDTEDTEVDDIPGLFDQLAKEKPHFFYNTWQPPANEQGQSQVQIFIQGVAEDYEDEEPEDEETEEEEDEEESEDEETEEDEDSEEDEESEDEEEEETEDDEETDDEEEEESEEEDEEEEEPKPRKGKKPNTSKAVKGKKTTAKKKAEPEPEEVEPVKGDVFLWRASPKAKLKEVKILSVQKTAKTVRVLRVDDEVEFSKVKWSDLKSAD